MYEYRISRPGDWGSNEYKKILLSSLKEYKGAMADSLYNVLNAMLELEVSALSTEITPNQREKLTKVDFNLYRYISIYNLFVRIQKLFEEDKDKIHVHKTNWANCLEMYVPAERIVEDDWDEKANLYLFDFDFKPNDFIPGVKDRIGDIGLHEYVVREGQNAKNVETLNNIIVKLGGKRYGTFAGTPEDKSDPATYGSGASYPTCNDDMLMARYLRNEQIKNNEVRIEYYQNKKGLTEPEKLAIELAGKYHEKLLQELGFAPEEFKPYNSYTNQQTLTLSRPNFNIYNTIHYVE